MNLKIQAGGLHSPTPTLLNAKCFMGREGGEYGRGRREKRTSMALRKEEGKLGLVVAFTEICWEPLPKITPDLGLQAE